MRSGPWMWSRSIHSLFVNLFGEVRFRSGNGALTSGKQSPEECRESCYRKETSVGLMEGPMPSDPGGISGSYDTWPRPPRTCCTLRLLPRMIGGLPANLRCPLGYVGKTTCLGPRGEM